MVFILLFNELMSLWKKHRNDRNTQNEQKEME